MMLVRLTSTPMRKEGLDSPPGLQSSESFAVPFVCLGLDFCQMAFTALSFLVFNHSTKRTVCCCFFSSVHLKKYWAHLFFFFCVSFRRLYSSEMDLSYLEWK